MQSGKQPNRLTGCQTLYRSLDIISAVADNIVTLAEISDHINVSGSTTYRLASALVLEGYLNFESKKGYSLGHRLIQLGFLAYNQFDLVSVAKPYLDELAKSTLDTVHLAMREKLNVYYLDKISGSRAVQISSIIGGHKCICNTGVGKALLLDETEEEWRETYRESLTTNTRITYTEEEWINLLKKYSKEDYSLDLGEDVEEIRCVAAPIRNGNNKIIAAVSVSSTVQYMDKSRMDELIPIVKKTALEISHKLGWIG